jgi:hypothetical protein
MEVKHTLVDVGEDTALGDGDMAKKLVQLLIVPDGELKVARDDTGLLVVARSIASQLEDFGGEILEDSGEVDGSTGTDTLSVVALPQETVDTADREGQTSLGGTAEGKLATCNLCGCEKRETRPKNQDRVPRNPDRGAMDADS